jgi:predicted lipoprotein with Yx(FWY)xxD motif
MAARAGPAPDDALQSTGHMRLSRTGALLALAACGGGLVAGCGNSDEGGSDEGKVTGAGATRPAADRAPAAGPTRRSRRGPKVKLRDSQLGPVLFDGHNRALYLFTRDGRNRTRCYGACAEAWPPFLAKGRPRAARGVDPSLLDRIRRRGGARQVTYKGKPLYFYVHDPRGRVLCNDVVEFGGTWFAVNAEGDPPR